VKLRVEGTVTFAVHPRPFPDVYLGEQAVFTGRYRDGGRHAVVVTARVAGKPMRLTAEADFPSEPGGSVAVRDLHARQRLSYLESVRRLRSGLSDAAYYAALDRGQYSTESEIVREIIGLSMATGVQSAYTSFLVLLPEDKARLDPRDRKSLAAAFERARSRRRELAGEAPRLRPDRPVVDGHRPEPVEEAEKQVQDPVLGDADEEDASFEEALGTQVGPDSPFVGPATKSVIGVGGGAGGRFGRGRGGKRNLRAGGGGRRTQTAVDLALEWLKRHQSPDGKWEAAHFSKRCKQGKCTGAGEAVYDPGVSGLALLCFLGYGETHRSGAYKNEVEKGLKYLRNIQDAEGCIGPQTTDQFMYGHVCATLALTEIFDLTGSRLFKEPAQRGVNFIRKADDPYLAWRYGVPPRDDDLYVSGWTVAVIKSARDGGLDVGQDPLKGALDWIERMTDAKSGRVGGSERITAVAILTRALAGQDLSKQEVVRKGASVLAAHPPRWDPAAGAIDEQYWLFGTFAMFQVGGERWKGWQEGLKEAIVDRQRREKGRDEYGSWDPVGPWSLRGGRVQSTALLCLCQQMYFRYGKVISMR
jgi:hypothetical protein